MNPFSSPEFEIETYKDLDDLFLTLLTTKTDPEKIQEVLNEMEKDGTLSKEDVITTITEIQKNPDYYACPQDNINMLVGEVSKALAGIRHAIEKGHIFCLVEYGKNFEELSNLLISGLKALGRDTYEYSQKLNVHFENENPKGCN